MARDLGLQGIDSQLAGFVRALRAAGAEASVAEAIDAARAVQLVGYADRETLKSSLSVALAKSEEEKAICDEVFELYFRLPERSQDADPNTEGDGQGGGPHLGQGGNGAEHQRGGAGGNQQALHRMGLGTDAARRGGRQITPAAGQGQAEPQSAGLIPCHVPGT